MAEDPDESTLFWYLAWRGAILVAVVMAFRTSKFLRFHGYFTLYYALCIILTAGCIPIFLLKPFSVENSLIFAKLMRNTTRLFGIRWEIRGGEILGMDGGAVVVANHQSSLDFLGMTQIWSALGKCTATAKVELFYIWPFGLSGWLGGVLYLDRSNPGSAKKQLEKTMQVEKTKLWIFPEGTRNRKSKTFLPFKKGAFRVAIGSQVPLLPVVYSPYYFIDDQKYEYKRGKMVMQALAAIPTLGLTMDDLDDLVERTRSVMQQAFNALAAEAAAAQNNTPSS